MAKLNSLVQIRLRPDELKKLNRAMASLPERVRKKAVRGAVRAWGRDTARLIRNRLPKRTGRLRRSVAVKVKTNRRGVWAAVGGKTTTRAAVGIHKAAKLKQQIGWDYLGAGWRLHFIERGFRPRGGRRRVEGLNIVARVAVGRRLIFADTLQRDVNAAIVEAAL